MSPEEKENSIKQALEYERKIENEIESEFIDIFQLANLLKESCFKVKNEINVYENDAKSITIISLFFKTLTSLSALIKIAKCGMASDASTILRTMIEATIKLKACANIDGFHEKYIYSDFCRRKKLLNAVKNASDENAKNLLDGQNIEELDAKLDENIKKYNAKPINLDEISKNEHVKMEIYYLMVYRMACISVHSSSRFLNDILKFEGEKLKEINIGPNKNLFHQNVITGMMMVLFCLDCVAEHFEIKNTDIKEIEKKLLYLSKKYSNLSKNYS